jgi:CRISPR-associated endonuclease/helicase Cas3
MNNNQEQHSGTPDYFLYRGKLNRNQEGQAASNYHLLAYHCLDVAAVGWQLLVCHRNLLNDLATLLEMPKDSLCRLLVFALALHDLGKFSSAFQQILANSHSQLTLGNTSAYDAKDYRHDQLGSYFYYRAFSCNEVSIKGWNELSGRDKRIANQSLWFLFCCTLGHHGQPVKNDYHSDEPAYRGFIEDSNIAAANEFIADLLALLEVELPIEKLCDKNWLQQFKLVSWILAGWAVAADWLGSDQRFFSYYSTPAMDLQAYWHYSRQQADKAVAATDLMQVLPIKPFSQFKASFGFSPTPLQQWAEQIAIDDSPQLFILEDITGAGKTEAALALTHRLMAAGAADGFYFGLPTMATSNAMFDRVGEHYLSMYQPSAKKPSLVLAHGMRDMDDRFRQAVFTSAYTDSSYYKGDETASIFCNRWLADSRKKALLAPVGVGTIDQALMAVLPRRHQSLRVLGLYRKVLIVEEIHSADDYMLELLATLLALHKQQGGSAILLTATLDLQKRERLCAIWQAATTANNSARLTQQQAFLLATKVPLNGPLIEQPVASRAELCRRIKVNFLHRLDEISELIIGAVQQGQSVVWVRNTVDDAQQAYNQVRAELMARGLDADNSILFHSRFILADRQIIEAKVIEIFGKKSGGLERKGKVLIATQVFQESLDADTDLLISDLCPIDHLLQRAGRLHRHCRDQQGYYRPGITDSRPPPILYVYAPEWQNNPGEQWLLTNFTSTQAVYRSHARLWLTMKILKQLGSYQLPQDARTLIEAVYSAEAQASIPPGLHTEEQIDKGEKQQKIHYGKHGVINWQNGYSITSHSAWIEDNHEISTRFADIKTFELVLVNKQLEQLQPWVTNKEFAIALSTLKLPDYKIEQLTGLVEQHNALAQDFVKRYPQAKYKLLWCVAEDSTASYSPQTGFQVAKKDCL